MLPGAPWPGVVRSADGGATIVAFSSEDALDRGAAGAGAGARSPEAHVMSGAKLLGALASQASAITFDPGDSYAVTFTAKDFAMLRRHGEAMLVEEAFTGVRMSVDPVKVVYRFAGYRLVRAGGRYVTNACPRSVEGLNVFTTDDALEAFLHWSPLAYLAETELPTMTGAEVLALARRMKTGLLVNGFGPSAGMISHALVLQTLEENERTPPSTAPATATAPAKGNVPVHVPVNVPVSAPVSAPASVSAPAPAVVHTEVKLPASARSVGEAPASSSSPPRESAPATAAPGLAGGTVRDRVAFDAAVLAPGQREFADRTLISSKEAALELDDLGLFVGGTRVSLFIHAVHEPDGPAARRALGALAIAATLAAERGQTDVGGWLDGLHAATILGLEPQRDRLGAVRLESLRPAQRPSPAPEFVLRYARCHQQILRGDRAFAETLQTLVADRDAAIARRPIDAWTLYGCLGSLFTIALLGDEAMLAREMEAARAVHHAIAEAHEPSARLPFALALGPMALRCIARRRGLRCATRSDYFPERLGE